jgi:hypothetical protein
VRTVTPLAASTGASNHIRRSPIRRPGARGAPLKRRIQPRVRQCSPFQHPSRPSASSIPAPAVSILAYHRVRFPEILPPHLPDTKREPRGGEERARHSQAAARYNCTALCLLRPSSPLSFSTRRCRVLLATQTRAPATAQPVTSPAAHGRRGEGDAAGKRRRLWLAGARWEWDTPVVQSHGAELLRRGRVHAPLRRGAQQHPVL